MTFIQQVTGWMKQWNLFKSVNKRSANDIKQQRIVTRIYVILFTSMIIPY